MLTLLIIVGVLVLYYDGTGSSNSESSVNYTIQEYVNDSISTFVDGSHNKAIFPIPNIIYRIRRYLLPIILF